MNVQEGKQAMHNSQAQQSRKIQNRFTGWRLNLNSKLLLLQKKACDISLWALNEMPDKPTKTVLSSAYNYIPR